MNPRPKRLKLLRWLPSKLVTTAGPRDERALYLTFDDGPHPAHTPPLLDFLAEQGSKASFFLIGKEAQAHAGLARRIVAEGHTLGNHSYSHPPFDELSLDQQLEEIAHTDRVLTAIDERAQHGFRTPRGVLPPRLMLNLLRQGRSLAYWSYDSLDYSRRPATELIEIILQHPLRAGDIILMHDDSPISLEMLRTLIPHWKSEGFSLRALPPGL